MDLSKSQESDEFLLNLRRRMYRIWTSSVIEYTARALTKPSDKLPAIQSIATEMATAINDTYIPFAGMWKGNLNNELLWQVQDGPRSKPASYRAPSWSWASFDTSITWNNGPVQPKSLHSSVKSDNFQLISVSLANAVAPEFHLLKLKAYIKPVAFIIECENDDRWIYGSRGTFPYDVFFATATSAQISDTRSFTSLLPYKDRQPAIGQGLVVKFAEGSLDLDDKDGLTNTRRSLAYLHVNHTSRPSGLILESEETGQRVWKRVGVATLFDLQSNLFSESVFGAEDLPIEITIL